MTDPSPLISIVTPSFNQGRFIEQTILSVINQDYSNLEYLIIDGGSTDTTVEIIRQYEPRLAYWVSEPDAGQAEAVNKGWARCRGEILGWLNSDDYYLPGALQTVAETFQANPRAGVVYGLGLFVSENGTVLSPVGAPVSPQQMINQGFYSLPQPAVFLRHAVIERVGGLDPSFHFALDGEFFCRAFANFEAVHLPVPLACLRLHRASKSVSRGRGFAPELLRMAEKITAAPQSYPRCQVRREAVLSGAYLNRARFFYNNSSYRDALLSLIKSLRLSKAHARQVLFRELPRLVTHRLIGRRAYVRLGTYLKVNLRRDRSGTSLPAGHK